MIQLDKREPVSFSSNPLDWFMKWLFFSITWFKWTTYLIGDIEEYQINLLINIIKHYKIIRNETQLYISYREI